MKEDVKKLIDEIVDELDTETRKGLAYEEHMNHLCLFGKRDSRYLKGVAAKAKKFWIPVRWFDCPPPTDPGAAYLVDGESYPLSENGSTDPAYPRHDLDRTGIDNESHLSCTAEACLEILDHIPGTEGKHVCIIGRGHAVQMLGNALLYRTDCTVTVCHSKTENLREVVATADIVINSAPRLNPYTDVGFKLNRILLDISGALSDWEDSNLLTYIGPREIGRVNTSVVLNRFANM